MREREVWSGEVVGRGVAKVKVGGQKESTQELNAEDALALGPNAVVPAHPINPSFVPSQLLMAIYTAHRDK